MNNSFLERRIKNLKKISKSSTREDIINVFTPKISIKNPAKFVGRSKYWNKL